MGQSTMSADQKAIRLLAENIRSGTTATSQKAEIPASLSKTEPVARVGPFLWTPTMLPLPVSTSTPQGPAQTGPSLRGSQEQLEEARLMSKSFSRSSTSRPPRATVPQTFSSRTTINAPSPKVAAAQGYGLEAIALALSAEALAGNPVPPHKRAAIKSIQAPSNENENTKKPFQHESKSSKMKSTPSTSITSHTHRVETAQTVPSVRKAPISGAVPNVITTVLPMGKMVAERVPAGQNNAVNGEEPQTAKLTASGPTTSDHSKTVPSSKSVDATLTVESPPRYIAVKPDTLENTVRQLASAVERLQQDHKTNTMLLYKLEEERERRFFLGTGTQSEPFTVDVLCQNGFSGKVQTHLAMSGADLIRSIRGKAGVNHLDSENIVVKVGTKPLAHIAMVGEQGVAPGTELIATW